MRHLHAIDLLLIGVSLANVLLTAQQPPQRAHRPPLGEKRLNSMGIDGLIYRPQPGRPRKLAGETVASTNLPVVDDPSLANHTHWTVTKLCGWLREEKQLDLSYRTLVRYLHEHGYARRIPRRMPEPPDRDQWEDRREIFCGELLALLEDNGCDVFFGDEAGFEGDPRPRQKRVKRSSRPTQGYYGGHVRQNVVGSVNPASGQLVSLIVPHCHTEVYQAFLDNIAAEVPVRKAKRVLLVLDNASWHKTERLDWHHIKPVFLPPSSPDLNPIERLWQHLKSRSMDGYITKRREELNDKIFASQRALLDRPELSVRSAGHTPNNSN